MGFHSANAQCIRDGFLLEQKDLIKNHDRSPASSSTLLKNPMSSANNKFRTASIFPQDNQDRAVHWSERVG